MYKCIIIDDDDLDRMTVEFHAREAKIFSAIKSFDSAFNAMETLDTETPDVLFLDIDMPGINGMEFRKKYMQVPVCVFISSHGEYALNAFEIKASDFIQKPLKQERFLKTIQTIEEILDNKTKSKLFETYTNNTPIIVKAGNQTLQIMPYDILYLEAMKNNTKIQTKQQAFYIPKGMGELMNEDGFTHFIRIHKSFATQKRAVKKIVGQKVLLENDVALPIGRKYKASINL